MNAARTGMNVPQILTILVVLLGLALSAWLVYMIRQTLLPFGIAFFLSYVLMPLVDRLESRGMPRIAGVLVIYAGMVGLLGFTFVSFVPVLGRGISDFRDRVLGENAVWTCILTNPGASEVGISRADAPHPDFSVEGLPLLLSPGGQDTIRIHFAPNDAAARTGHISLVGTTGATTKEQVLGRVFVVANVWEATSGSSNDEQAAAFPVVPHQTLHSFGRLKPGVLSDLKAILATYQPTMAEHLPMLAEVDLADALNQRAKVWATQLLQQTPALVGTLVSGVTLVVIVPMVAFFFMIEGRSIKRAFVELIPNPYFEMVLSLIYRIDQQIGGYIRGLVVSVIIVSLLSISGLWTIGLRDYLVVGTLAGLSNVIPYLGPIIGIAAGVLAAMLQYGTLGWAILLPVVAVFLIVQIVDNVFIQPVVVAKSVNLHPLIVIFVVLVGNHLFGPVGMLLAVPFTAVTKVSAQTIYHGLRSYSAGV